MKGYPMHLSDFATEVISNLKRKKLRSSLTTMGIVIGTLSILMVWGLGAGLKNFLHRQVRLASDPASLKCFPPGGINPQSIKSMVVGIVGQMPRKVQEKQESAGWGEMNLVYFSEKDIREIKGTPHVQSVHPMLVVPAHWGRLEGSEACFEIYFTLWKRNLSSTLLAGSSIEEGDENTVILSYAYCKAFGIDNPKDLVGKNIEIKIGKHPFLYRYVQMGILRESLQSFGEQIRNFFQAKKKGQKNDATSISGPDGMDCIFKARVKGVLAENIFSSTAFASGKLLTEMGRFFLHQPDLFSNDNYGFAVTVNVDEEKNIPSVKKALWGKKMPTVNQDDLFLMFERIFWVVETTLTLFGLVAFFVAALGIVNTLLISVYERKNEIGVLKALGATRGDIWFLFALEASAIGFLGGVIGALLSLGIGALGNHIAARVFSLFWQKDPLFYFHLWFFPAVFSFTTLVGLIGGSYPAYRASTLEPIEALR